MNKLQPKLQPIEILEDLDEKVSSSTMVMPYRKNPAAVKLGRLGGIKGGPARAAKLSAEERSEIAQKAARVRWKKG